MPSRSPTRQIKDCGIWLQTLPALPHHPQTQIEQGALCSSQSHRTALLSHQPLGSAEVTHPFHPLRGQRFVVLKVRRVAGVETLSLRHHDLGSFAIAREWTDWAPPGAPAVSAGKSL